MQHERALDSGNALHCPSFFFLFSVAAVSDCQSQKDRRSESGATTYAAFAFAGWTPAVGLRRSLQRQGVACDLSLVTCQPIWMRRASILPLPFGVVLLEVSNGQAACAAPLKRLSFENYAPEINHT